MNAIELFHQDGKPAQVWYCGKCRNVAASQILTEKCCKPNICDCGKECEKQYYTICDDREKLKREQRTLDRFNSAEKIDKWDGWVYSDGHGYNDGYASTIEEIIDYCKDGGIDIPDYVWTCTEHRFAHICLDNILQNIEENGYEDFSAENLKGVKDLKIAIDNFNNINYDIISYEPNYKKALIINK